jgi:hypothetical protein
MIYVKRDAGIIPQELLGKAVAAQDALEQLPANERAEHIKKNSKIWRDFKNYLSQMSYGKCWYSESPEVQSHLDVDHFRPKLEARRDEKVCDKPGYEWLAFSWDNFRLSLNCRIGLSAMKRRMRRTGREVGFLSSMAVQRPAGKIAVSMKSGQCYSIRPRQQMCVSSKCRRTAAWEPASIATAPIKLVCRHLLSGSGWTFLD